MSHEPEPEAGGRGIPDPAFAGDDGSAHPGLAATLAAYATDPERHLEVFMALQEARLLVPVVAVPGDVQVDGAGRTREKTSDMATVLITGRDGRQALLGFTCLESLTAWRADARPVPVPAASVALSAVEGGAAALLVDIAGPVPYVLEGELLEGLARRWALADTGQGLAWVEEVDDEDDLSE